MIAAILLAASVSTAPPCEPEYYFIPVEELMYSFVQNCDGSTEQGPTWRIEDMKKVYEAIHGKTWYI